MCAEGSEVNPSQTAVMGAVMDEPPASSNPPRPHTSSRDEEEHRQAGDAGEDCHTPTQAAARGPVGCSLDVNGTPGLAVDGLLAACAPTPPPTTHPSPSRERSGASPEHATGEANAEAMEPEPQRTTIDPAQRAEDSNGVRPPMDTSTAEDPPAQATVATTPIRTPTKVRTRAGVFRAARRHAQPARRVEGVRVCVCEALPEARAGRWARKRPAECFGVRPTRSHTHSHTHIRTSASLRGAQARCIIARCSHVTCTAC